VDETGSLTSLVTSLACGLLIGMERERHPETKAGVRTFALVALLGTVSAMLSPSGSAWLLAAGIVVIGGIMAVAHATHPSSDGDPGTTTTAALLICYLVGAMLWHGERLTAATLTLAVTALLYFKDELHDVTRVLSRRDIVSFLQFAMVAFVILPVLPNRDFGPLGSLNPFQAGVMVVVVSGISLAGYAALRILGPNRGLLLAGALGGMVSSTATTIAFARHVRRAELPVGIATVVILIANVMTLLRISALTAIFAPALLSAIAPAVCLATIAGVGCVWLFWKRFRDGTVIPRIEIANPTELGTALLAGLAFTLILLGAAWLNLARGTTGLYSGAALFGLTDLDATTLSTVRLYQGQHVEALQAGNALILAYCSNMVLKVGLSGLLGGSPLLRLVSMTGGVLLVALITGRILWH
jgi:uncharacterized membrane protein (DUF4010 family)